MNDRASWGLEAWRLRMSPAAIASWAGAFVGAFLFGRWIHFDLLRAGSAFWQAPAFDLPIMLSGYEAVVRAPWSFPPTVTHALVAPGPLSIVYTDSIPWLTLLFKATGAWRWLNPLGVFWLLSYVLQPVAMVRLLRALGVERLSTLLAGALLALLMPPWLMRHGHVALTAHWILLAGLALSVSSARAGLTPGRAAGFVGLLAFAAGIHAYHLPPLLLCFAAALGSELLQRRPSALRRCAAAAAAAVVVLAGCYVILGYGAGGAGGPGVDALGYYAMNLLGPFLPEGSTLIGQSFKGDGFAHTLDATGAAAFEGFAYLGAGILALGLVAAVLELRAGSDASGASGARALWIRRWGPLVAALAVLFLAAAGPAPHLAYRELFHLRLPHALDLLGAFRSHGRFNWLVGYALLAAALVAIERRLGGRAATIVLAGAIAVQVVDTHEVRTEVRYTFAQPHPTFFPEGLVSAREVRGRPLVFASTADCASDPLDRLAIAQMTLVALRRGGISNGAGTAHVEGRSCAFDSALEAPAAPGDTRITVVLQKSAPAETKRIGRRADCRDFQRGLICGRGLEGLAGSQERVIGAADNGVVLAAWRFDEGKVSPVLTRGWSAPDPHGVWSDGPAAEIRLPPPAADPAKPLVLELDAMSYMPPPGLYRPVEVSVNGQRLAHWDVKIREWKPYRLNLPPGSVKQGQPLVIGFSIPNPGQPGGGDRRRIGLGVERLVLSQ